MMTYEVLLPPAMTIAVTIPMLLSALQELFPSYLSRYLPFGGSDFKQVAIFVLLTFGLVVITVELGHLNHRAEAAPLPQAVVSLDSVGAD